MRNRVKSVTTYVKFKENDCLKKKDVSLLKICTNETFIVKTIAQNSKKDPLVNLVSENIFENVFFLKILCIGSFDNSLFSIC